MAALADRRVLLVRLTSLFDVVRAIGIVGAQRRARCFRVSLKLNDVMERARNSSELRLSSAIPDIIHKSSALGLIDRQSLTTDSRSACLA